MLGIQRKSLLFHGLHGKGSTFDAESGSEAFFTGGLVESSLLKRMIGNCSAAAAEFAFVETLFLGCTLPEGLFKKVATE